MNYPLISEYLKAIKSTEGFFNELSYLKPVLDADGSPIMTSGSTSVVFKMIDEQREKYYAVKCYTEEQENRENVYLDLSQELEAISSPYFISARYIEKELYVDTVQTSETKFPVLLMDWVDGKTLENYLFDNIDNQYALDILTYRFGLLTNWFMNHPVIHGGIKPENILVKGDGSIVLVDYDRMYVPHIENKESLYSESINNLPPSRPMQDFEENNDDLSLSTILLSLKIISQKPNLLKERFNLDYLLFTNDDINDISKSRIYIDYVQNQLSDNDFRVLNGLFLLACSKCSIKGLSFQLSRPLTTSISDEDWEEAKKNGKGWFSKDDQRFYGIYNPKYRNEDYKMLQLIGGSVVLDGDETKVICDYALSDVGHYTEIVFSESVETIGFHVFYNVNHIDRINFPKYLKNICGNPFEGVIIDEINNLSSNYVVNGYAVFSSMQEKLISYYSKKEEFIIANPTIEICERAFASNKYIKHIIISNGVAKIRKGAFANCSALEMIDLPQTLQTIEDEAFLHTWIEPEIPIEEQQERNTIKNYCDINSLTIPCGVNKIGRKAFLGIKSIKNESPFFQIVDDALLSIDGSELIYYFGKKSNYSIPKGVSVIYSCAFMNNQYLKMISVPDSVNIVEEYAFAQCHKLTKVTFKGKYAQIKQGVFSCCTALKDIRLPKLLSTISNETFLHCSSLTDFVLPPNLSVIGERAFYDCDSFVNLQVPDSVVEIGKSAFFGCTNIKEIKLPKCLKVISEQVFSCCEKLELIHFPDELEEISSGAFSYCKSIVRIELPSKLKQVGYRAFGSCDTLEKCYLSNPNTQIDEKTFDSLENDNFKLFLPKGGNISDYVKVMPLGIHGYTYYTDNGLNYDLPNFSHQYENIVPYMEDIPLEDILSDHEDTHWSYIDKYYRDEKGGIYTYGKQCFQGIDEELARNEKKYVVANGTKYICNRAFVTNELYNKCPFEEIVLPDSICAIGEKSFWDTKIENIILPTSLTYIGDFAFEKCNDLESITIPFNTREIGKNPFKNTSSLQSIHSDSPQFTIVSECLATADLSIVICCFSKRKQTNRIIEIKDFWENTNSTYYYELNICELPSGIKCIGEYAFSNAEIKEIILPNTIEIIKESAFEGNSYITSMAIPNSVRNIGENCFKDCHQMRTIQLSESINQLCDFLFKDCSKLENIIIPDGVTIIGNFVFSGCGSIKTLKLPKSVQEIGANPFVDSGIESIDNCSEAFEIENNILYTRKKLRLIACFSKDKEIVLPDGLQMIDEYAFKGCCSIERVFIPSSVTSIGKHAFDGCTSLIKVEIESTNLSLLQEYCFTGCKNLIDIKIPNSVSEIERGVFNNCSSIKNIVLPKRIKKIHDWNFQNCQSFETIWLPFGVKKEALPWKLRGKGKEMSLEDSRIWIDDNGVAYSSDKRELVKADKSLTNYSILNGTEIINENAFSGCIGLQDLSLPNSILEIKSGAFNFCGVKELNLPNSVVKLGNGLFSGFNGYYPLREIVIPASVEEMDGNPFAGYALKVYNESNHFMMINDIIYTSNLKRLISYLAVGEERLRIADIVKVIGKYAFASCKLKEIIVPDSVEEIGKFAFYGSSLQSISLPETISVINESTFQHCGLKHIVLPQSIIELKSHSFCDCFDLENVSIPSNVVLVEDSAFGACRSLDSVTILSSNVKIAPSSFRYCDKLRVITVPRGCKERFTSMLPEQRTIIKEVI